MNSMKFLNLDCTLNYVLCLKGLLVPIQSSSHKFSHPQDSERIVLRFNVSLSIFVKVFLVNLVCSWEY